MLDGSSPKNPTAQEAPKTAVARPRKMKVAKINTAKPLLRGDTGRIVRDMLGAEGSM